MTRPRGRWNTMRSVVASSANIADNSIVRGADGEKDVQGSTAYITDAGDMGVGKTAPAAKLHVEGNTRTNGRYVMESSNDSNLFNFDNSLGVFRIFREDWNASGQGSNGAVRFAMLDNGNAAFGFTAPDEKLEVNGAFGIVDGMTAPSAVVGKAFTYIDSADGDYKIIFGDGTIKTLATDT